MLWRKIKQGWRKQNYRWGQREKCWLLYIELLGEASSGNTWSETEGSKGASFSGISKCKEFEAGACLSYLKNRRLVWVELSKWEEEKRWRQELGGGEIRWDCRMLQRLWLLLWVRRSPWKNLSRGETKWLMLLMFYRDPSGGAWVTQLVRRPTSFSSGHDLTVCGFEPRVGLCAGSSEPGACFRFCVFLSPPPCSCSVSLCVSKMNKF